MPQSKKLIEVAMPVKEISVESVRDKSIRHGHISTLHLWWARRPLPVCRAVVFASLVPDPLDENCPQQFKDAVNTLLAGYTYRPYEDIPFTASVDPMDDNPRNRLLMFIGKYSKKFIQVEKSGAGTCAPKETLDNGSLIKWENKNNESILSIARKLIFVAHNAAAATTAVESNANCNVKNNSISNNNFFDNSSASCEELLSEFDQLYSAIKSAETDLYETPNRHLQTEEVKYKEETIHSAIEAFLDKMPNVYDPFAGGGAIPLEAARLGCRTFANDLNPVAYIIEKASIEFPQKYGKPITFTIDEFIKIYGEEELHKQEELKNVFGNKVNIANRLSFDVEFYAKKLLKMTEDNVGHIYPKDKNGQRPIAYYWARVAHCENPSCKAEVPLLKSFYICDKPDKKIYLKPILNAKEIKFEINKGKFEKKGWNHRGNLECPFCGNVTDVKKIKQQSKRGEIKLQLLAAIEDSSHGRNYRLPTQEEKTAFLSIDESIDVPSESMQRNSAGGDTFSWGISKWGQLFTKRQLYFLYALIDSNKKISDSFLFDEQYAISLITYLSIYINRIAIRQTSFGLWHLRRETVDTPFGRQAIPMIFDFPEANPFSSSSGGSSNQSEWICKFIEGESAQEFSAFCLTPKSAEYLFFEPKSLDIVVTDPPYYDSIAYADISDFFYVWFKRTLFDKYRIIFSTPQTPKSEECTALKHHHDGNSQQAKSFFEIKLRSIFTSIENQTLDMICIMFAHQSTEAWTTLCNSILSSNMNITGSWANDTEMTGALKTNKAFLASSVTVSCLPTQRQGIGDSKEVKNAIELKVKREVEELYKLGFRGADLLTACFGPAVSEFGKYERVEKASGEEVTVEELLTWARDAAFNAIVSDIPTDDFTRFYIGWLNLFGFSETEHDDVRRITQIGLHLDVNELLANHLLIRNGNKQTLATFITRAAENKKLGDARDSFTIDLVHKALYLLKNNNRKSLLEFIGEHAQNQEDIFWRVANSLKEVLPKGMEDQKQISELLANKDNLIKDSKSISLKLGEQEDMFKQ